MDRARRHAGGDVLPESIHRSIGKSLVFYPEGQGCDHPDPANILSHRSSLGADRARGQAANQIDGIEPCDFKIEIQVARRELFELEHQIWLVPCGKFRQTIVGEREADFALRAQMRNSFARQIGQAGPLGSFPASVSEEDIIAFVDADDAPELKLADGRRDLLNLTFRMPSGVARIRLEVADRHVFDGRSTQCLRQIVADSSRPPIPI